jgi:sn-glycerol 3-phosphate transport system ATP-binding protein
MRSCAREMRLEIRALQRKLGITMVYVTHDQVEAMSMADRVVLMRAGRIEQDGTPVDLYEDPANTFVARFIGTPPMNLLRSRGRSRRRGHRRHRRSGGARRPLRPGLLGVRPEHMELGFETGIRAQVDNVEYLGGDSLVSCRIGSQALAFACRAASGCHRAMRRGSLGTRRQHYFAADGHARADRCARAVDNASGLDSTHRMEGR